MQSIYFNAEEPTSFNYKLTETPAFLKEFLNYKFMSQNCSPQTLFNYYVSMQTFLRWTICRDCYVTIDEFKEINTKDVTLETLAAIEPRDIAEYMMFLATVLKNASASRSSKLSAISGFYDFCLIMQKKQDNKKNDEDNPYKIITGNPTDTLDRPRQEYHAPKFLTEEECVTLLSSVPEGTTYTRDYCMLVFFLNLAIRLNELVKINMTDIRGELIIVHGKERKDRILWLNEPCMNALEAYLADRANYPESDNDALFISNRKGGDRLSGRRVEQITERCLIRAGLAGRGFTPHTLRHTRATNLSNAGIPTAHLRDILGHANISSTERYLHTSQSALNDALKYITISDKNKKDGKE